MFQPQGQYSDWNASINQARPYQEARSVLQNKKHLFTSTLVKEDSRPLCMTYLGSNIKIKNKSRFMMEY
jgi:hypothetical protein